MNLDYLIWMVSHEPLKFKTGSCSHPFDDRPLVIIGNCLLPLCTGYGGSQCLTSV